MVGAGGFEDWSVLGPLFFSLFLYVPSPENLLFSVCHIIIYLIDITLCKFFINGPATEQVASGDK